MDVGERRRQLLRFGMELFSKHAYDDVWIEDVAERAGVSRGLLYHYFPTKRDFYVAVTRAAAEEAGAATEPNPALEPAEQLRASVDAFLRYAEEHSHGFLTAYRGALAGDPEVREIVEDARRRQTARIVELVAAEKGSTRLLSLAVHGWVALTQDVTAQWLQERDPDRETVREMLIATLAGAVSAAAGPGGATDARASPQG
jgi:AcrR family transcriptional regulator